MSQMQWFAVVADSYQSCKNVIHSCPVFGKNIVNHFFKALCKSTCVSCSSCNRCLLGFDTLGSP